MRSTLLAGAIILALGSSQGIVMPALAGSYQPLWVQAPPKDPAHRYVVGAAKIVSDPETAKQEAIKEAIRKLDGLVGFDDSPDQVELKRTFNRTLIRSLAEGRAQGPVIEDIFQQDAPQSRFYVLLRYPARLLAEARSELSRKRPKQLALPEAVRLLAEGFARYADVEPLVGNVAIGSFSDRESGKRFKLSNVIEDELGRAVSRLEGSPIRLGRGVGAMTFTGTYRLGENRRHLLMTGQVLDARNATVIWTSPEYLITEGDFSELAPQAPVSAPTAAPAVAKPTQLSKRPTKPLTTQQKVGKPRIMVILPETHISRPAPDPAGETELIRQLLEAGFKLVDQSQSKKVRENEQFLAHLQNDPLKVAALGREYGAEVVVFGEAFSETVGNAPAGVKVMARVEARAVRCDTAEILVAHGLESVATEASELVSAKKALRQAGQLVAKYFVEQLASRWSREAEEARSLEVLIADISYPQLVKLKVALKGEVDGVQAFHQRSYEQSLARFEVDYEGDPQDLVDTLVSRSFDGHELELVKLTGSKVEMRLR